MESKNVNDPETKREKALLLISEWIDLEEKTDQNECKDDWIK